MRHHFRHPQAMFNKGSLFYSHCVLDQRLIFLEALVKGTLGPKPSKNRTSFKWFKAYKCVPRENILGSNLIP
jgi:hypothetical protein